MRPTGRDPKRPVGFAAAGNAGGGALASGTILKGFRADMLHYFVHFVFGYIVGFRIIRDCFELLAADFTFYFFIKL
ncbi:MAG: hypothetical protein A2W19_13050 [Spirochaetes bacterium RBG_16_49_21]|nr:MAG: hypothetical protein A2W19_13050 [Spirochaetes bacterium RBG_16_49_21]